MDKIREIRPGDFIYALGYTFPVREVLYQDYYGDRSKAGTSDCWGHDVEFKDVDGRYHHWKQNQDGGGVIRVTWYRSTVNFRARIEQWPEGYQNEVKLLVFNQHGMKICESHYHAGNVNSALIDLKTRQPGVWTEDNY
jgi:hypothetical protein